MNFSKKINLNSETNLDLTPIVDVVFNLLIFFALSLNFSEITSSLNMISAISLLTKRIKLSSLTTNITFYNPSVLASHIALVDNLCKVT